MKGKIDMKTEFLKELGITDEQISSIMSENGKDIKREQDKYSKLEAENTNYKEQLETTQEALKKFDGVNVQEYQDQIKQLSEDMKSKETEFQTKLSDMEFSQTIEAAINGAGAKNAKAVKALLDMDNLKASKNQSADIKAAIEACQKDNGYLFGATEPINNAVLPTGGNDGGNGADTFTTALRRAAGLKE